MALFRKKPSTPSGISTTSSGAAARNPGKRCPICDTEFGDYSFNIEHGKQHLVGAPGKFGWECTCGDRDCCWEHDGQASLALLTHISDSHNMALDFFGSITRMRYTFR